MFRSDWKLDRLATIDVLARVPRRTLREVRTITTLLRLPAGTVLWQQGEVAREAFMLLDGELELTWDGTPLEVVRAGVVVGGVGLAAGAPRVATSTALTDVEVLVMSRSEYTHLLRLCPDVAGRVEAGHRARFAALRRTTAVA